MKGVSTVIATILMLIITIALAGMAYMYIAGVFSGAIQGIEVVDSFCEGGEVTITIRNIGTSAISSLNIKQTSPADDILTANFTGAIEPGKTASYKDTCEGSAGRSCLYRITPPIGKAATATAYCASKPSSLVLWLSFDEGSGSTAKDSSGNGNDGTIIDNEDDQWVQGKYGNALSFDGVNDYVNIVDPGDNSIFDITDKITIEAWFKLNSRTGWDRVVAKSHTTNTKPWTMYGILLVGGTACGDEEAGQVRFELASGGEQHIVHTTSKPQIGEWVHVVATYDGSSMKLYYNGKLESGQICRYTVGYVGNLLTGKIDTNNMPISIGRSGFDADYFNGTIDEVRIYNKAII